MRVGLRSACAGVAAAAIPKVSNKACAGPPSFLSDLNRGGAPQLLHLLPQFLLFLELLPHLLAFAVQFLFHLLVVAQGLLHLPVRPLQRPLHLRAHARELLLHSFHGFALRGDHPAGRKRVLHRLFDLLAEAVQIYSEFGEREFQVRLLPAALRNVEGKRLFLALAHNADRHAASGALPHPAASAGLPFSTERTSTPCPFFTPKNSPSCGVRFSTTRPLRREYCSMVGKSKSKSMGGISILGISMCIGLEMYFLRSANCALMVSGWPSRLIPRATVRPGGVSRIIRRNCSALSTGLPLKERITSCSFSPAFPAGASWSTIVISTPRSALSLR